MRLQERIREHYTRPGPGVDKDAPRKTGLARLWQILTRHFGALMGSGLVTTLGFVPLALGLMAAANTGVTALLPAVGLLGGAVAGPFLCALYDGILRMLRDEPFFWWHTYKKALRQDACASLLPGALMGLANSFVVLLAFADTGLSKGWVAPLAGVFLALMILPFWFAQVALMDLPLAAVLKNALLLAFGMAPRTLAAAFLQLICWGVLFWLLPWSLIWLVLFGLWSIGLMTLHTLYRPLEKTFDLEEKFRQKREAELSSDS